MLIALIDCQVEPIDSKPPLLDLLVQAQGPRNPFGARGVKRKGSEVDPESSGDDLCESMEKLTVLKKVRFSNLGDACTLSSIGDSEALLKHNGLLSDGSSTKTKGYSMTVLMLNRMN